MRLLIIDDDPKRASLLLLYGALWRSQVTNTLIAHDRAPTTFLDRALRDRSRYLAATLQPRRAHGHWPNEFADGLARNDAESLLPGGFTFMCQLPIRLTPR